MIIRKTISVRHDITVVENSVIHDLRLSFGAKGLYCMIASRENMPLGSLVVLYGECVIDLAKELKRVGLIRFEREEEDS